MKVKKYLAPTLPEAMAKVRQELGRDAIILHTQRVKVPGLPGWLGRTQVEVTAATDDVPSPAPSAHLAAAPSPAGGLPPSPGEPFERPVAAASPLPLPAQGAAAPAPTASALPAARAAPATDPAALPQAGAVVPFPRAARPPQIDRLEDEINQVKAMMTQLLRRMDAPGAVAALPEPLRRLHADLIGAGVQADLAGDLLSQVSRDRRAADADGRGAAAALGELIAARLGRPAPVEVGHGRRVVALIGPTGVGKTTTLAKLAAHFALSEKRSVALLTADTYRIAAVEQLRTYGEIIGVPVEVVFTPSELKAALRRHEGCDLVFIDTAGRSHKNPMQMSELKGLLDAAQPHETHLVLSLTTNLREAQEVLRNFEPVGYNRLLLTKLDENSSPGQVLNLAVAAGRSLSYVTTGQNVPDDMEIAEPEKLAKAILGG